MDSPMKNVKDDLSQSNWHVQVLIQNNRTFVDEVFFFLLDHFGFRARPKKESRFLTRKIEYAILTIGYVFRRRLRTYFQNARINMEDVNEFQRLAEHFKLIKDECYFFRILTRVSHIFELTMYYLEKGYDYTDTARTIAATDDSTVFFQTNGGFSRLHQTAVFIADVGNVFMTIISEEKPKISGLKSFVDAAESVENCESVPYTEKAMTNLLKRNVVSKIGDISKLDPRVSKVFYNMICQHFSRVYTMSVLRLSISGDVEYVELDIENEKRAIIELFDMLVMIMLGETRDLCGAASTSIKLAKYFATFRHLTDIVSTGLVNAETTPERRCSQLDRNIHSSNKYFIVPKDEMRERKCEDLKSAQPGRLIISSDDTELTDAWTVLDSNIDAKNYFKLNDGRYVVYTPDCKFEDDTTAVVIAKFKSKKAELE